MYDIIPSSPSTDVQSVKVSTIEENFPLNKIKSLQWYPERLQDKTKPEVVTSVLKLLVYCNTDWSSQAS